MTALQICWNSCNLAVHQGRIEDGSASTRAIAHDNQARGLSAFWCMQSQQREEELKRQQSMAPEPSLVQSENGFAGVARAVPMLLVTFPEGLSTDHVAVGPQL